MKQSNRRIVVFVSLIGVLSLTSALLLALAPAPLTPDASSSLFAVDTPDSMDVIFQPQMAARGGRWKYIYVHQSRTASGEAAALNQNGQPVGDHFVIGNGEGTVDGQLDVQSRWMQQGSARPPIGANGIDPACISICMVGDFDHSIPTAAQLRRLTQLVNALQGRFDIPAGQVLLVNQAGSAAGAGRYFPVTAFREQLLP